MSEKRNPWCCVMECEAPATHEIGPEDPKADPYGETHACEKHVDALLPDGGAFVRRLSAAEMGGSVRA